MKFHCDLINNGQYYTEYSNNLRYCSLGVFPSHNLLSCVDDLLNPAPLCFGTAPVPCSDTACQHTLCGGASLCCVFLVTAEVFGVQDRSTEMMVPRNLWPLPQLMLRKLQLRAVPEVIGDFLFPPLLSVRFLVNSKLKISESHL